MKIAIFTANTGTGHQNAAKVLENYFLSKGEKVKIFRYEDYFKNVGQIYNFFMQFKPIYAGLYFFMNQKIIKDISNIIFGAKENFLNDLESFGPDFILNTANFVNERENIHKFKTGCKIFSLITDGYVFPNTWVEKYIDGYFVIDETSKKKFLKQNPNLDITTSFFPIEKKYFLDKKTINKKNFWFLLTDLERKVVKETIQMLLNNYECQITIVAGRNKKDFNFFSSKYKGFENVKFFEKIKLIENFDKIDIFFGKPGGALMCECIATDTPLVALGKLALQEDGNVNILQENKIGIYSKNIFSIKNFLDNIDDEILPVFHSIKKDTCEIIYKKFLDERK